MQMARRMAGPVFVVQPVRACTAKMWEAGSLFARESKPFAAQRFFRSLENA